MEFIRLYSDEQMNALMTALNMCAKDFDQTIYNYLEQVPKTSLVTELVDALNELGYRIVKK